jgi:putative DNA primase/helicase
MSIHKPQTYEAPIPSKQVCWSVRDDSAICFHRELVNAFGHLDWIPIPDGQIHRFYVPGDRIGTKNGWYVLFCDGRPAGVFGSWRNGCSCVWTSCKPVDRIEQQLMIQRSEKARRQREEEENRRRQRAAIKARWLWENSQFADPEHPYLRRKHVKPHLLRQGGDELLVPLCANGELVNLQKISPEGQKRFLFGGQVKGCYSLIGKPERMSPFYLCEGWATGASIHQLTGHPVACAMSSDNLLAVGWYIRNTFNDSCLIIAGDDDREVQGNPGYTKAKEAAETLGCVAVVPIWPAEAPPHLSDFNDLMQWQEAH